MTRPAPPPAPDLTELEDLLSEPFLLDDEEPADFEILRETLLEELAPRSAYERILADNLVAIEWEHRRLKRWLARLISDAAKARAMRALPDAREVGTLFRQWRNTNDIETSDAAYHRLTELGIDPHLMVAKAYAENPEVFAQLTSDIRAIEPRRRRLLEDYRMMQRRRDRADVADAEIVDDAQASD